MDPQSMLSARGRRRGRVFRVNSRRGNGVALEQTDEGWSNGGTKESQCSVRRTMHLADERDGCEMGKEFARRAELECSSRGSRGDERHYSPRIWNERGVGKKKIAPDGLALGRDLKRALRKSFPFFTSAGGGGGWFSAREYVAWKNSRPKCETVHRICPGRFVKKLRTPVSYPRRAI